MSDEIKIKEEVMSSPYDDNEHPNIRFDIKENEDVSKHLLFYKTDKKNSFSEGRKPSDILFEMFMEIQKLPKIKSKDDKKDVKTFNKFIGFIDSFIPHLVMNSNSETNAIKVDDGKKNVTIEDLHHAFKIASKGKRKSMLDQYLNQNA